MPPAKTTLKAKRDLKQGYAPTTAAGEFVEEEIHHQERRKHGSESRRQAIAIGLSKARRAGIPIGKRRGTHRPGSGRNGVSRRANKAKSAASRSRAAKKAARSRTRKKL